jgi:para-nitrobenzyl esterase
VDTESGPVRGVADGSMGDSGVAAFRGIPYAASPVGDRRFAPPEAHPPWPGPRDAVRSGPSVPQGPSRLEAVMGARVPDWNEDGCLTLNVWTSGLPAPGPAQRARPVLVWFHGGGFTSGSGGWDWYDGQNLAAVGDIVVVTANYRLGPFGYLYLPALGIENLGLQDQAAVLAWVQRNIAAFGGDPGRVTAGGQSAGAFSALYLALSPSTGPLISQVITQSGPWGLPPQDPVQATGQARRFLEILGLTGGLAGGAADSAAGGVAARADLRAALQAVPAGEFLTAYRQLAQEASRPGSAAPPMYPVLGAAGIPAAWPQALADGRLPGRPLLTGTTRDEMATIAAFADVDTEATFRAGTLAIAGHHATAGHRAYVYQFDHTPVPDPAHLGTPHCAELPFFFNTIDAYPGSPMLGATTPAVRALADTFSRAVAGFVATGRPAADRWHPYDPARPATVRHFP